MDLLPSEEQESIVEAVADLLAANAPLEVVREYVPSSGPGTAWTSLAEMGVFGLGIAESAGGAGLGLPEQVLVFREFGRFLTPGPLLGTVLAAAVAESAGDTELLESIVAGRAPAAVAYPVAGGAIDGERALSGRVRLSDFESAALCVVITPDRADVISLDRLQVTSEATLDDSASIGVVELDDSPVLAHDNSGRQWWTSALLIAALQVGIAGAARDEAVQYAKVREQFGQIIGGFQAVKHRCADMAMRAEVAHLQTVYASMPEDLTTVEAQGHIAAARIVAADAAHKNAADNIFTHGAMGFSAESQAHLFARRAAVLNATTGTDRWYLESLAAAGSLL